MLQPYRVTGGYNLCRKFCNIMNCPTLAEDEVICSKYATLVGVCLKCTSLFRKVEEFNALQYLDYQIMHT